MGGLTVMRALMTRLPGESFVYLGDTARLPYGTKSADTVRRYAVQASRALVARGVKLIVIACNTASVSLPQVQESLAPLPVMGVIEPGAKAALAAAPDGPIAVIATEGTVKGGTYRSAIRAQGSNAPIVQQACPLFVPLAEEGLIDGPIVDAIVHRYLDPLLATVPKPKALLLGCTHYPALKAAISAAAGDVVLVDSAMTTATAMRRSWRRMDNFSPDFFSSWQPVATRPAALRHANASSPAFHRHWRSCPAIAASPRNRWPARPTAPAIRARYGGR